MIELDILAAETLGRRVVENELLGSYRRTFSLSRSRIARILGTSSHIYNAWEADPSMSVRMHSMSAAKLGQLVNQLDHHEAVLREDNVEPEDLMPLGVLAGLLGISPRSAKVIQKCQIGEITCYPLGILGVYVPRAQEAKARGKK